MRNRIYVLSVMLIAVFAMTASAADISGKWVATMETPMGAMEITLNFTVDGETLTGTTSTEMGEETIEDGTVKGNDVAFIVNAGGGMFTITYKGTVSGDEIKFKVGMGEMGDAEMVAKRAE